MHEVTEWVVGRGLKRRPRGLLGGLVGASSPGSKGDQLLGWAVRSLSACTEARTALACHSRSILPHPYVPGGSPEVRLDFLCLTSVGLPSEVAFGRHRPLTTRTVGLPRIRRGPRASPPSRCSPSLTAANRSSLCAAVSVLLRG